MMENLNTVDEVQEQIVDAHEVLEESVTSEVAEPKPVQTAEENAHFAEQRRAREAAEHKAATLEKDYSIAKTYGRDYGVYSEEDIAANYSHLGITTLAEFEQAVERQKMVDEGIDPDILNQKLETHPEVIEARKTKERTQNYAEFEKFYTETVGAMPQIKDLPPEVIKAFQNGESMKKVFIEWDYKNLRNKGKAEEVNLKNAESSTGSVTGNGTPKNVTLTPEMLDNMTPKEIASRWQEVKLLFKMK